MSSYEKLVFLEKERGNKNNSSRFLVCERFLSQVKSEWVLNKKLITLEAIRREHETVKAGMSETITVLPATLYPSSTQLEF